MNGAQFQEDERNFLRKILWLTLAGVVLGAPLRAQTPRTFPFHAVHYEVEARLSPGDQTIKGSAKVEFAADEASRKLVVELHEDLRISAVKGSDGKPLTFERTPDNPLQAQVSLPDAYPPGKHVTVTFEYDGPISSEDDSPSKGLRLASIDATSAYLLLPSRWFPLTNYPANRYTATFKITAPDNFAVVGTGKSGVPDVGGGKVVYTFVNDRPSPCGTFVAGALQLNPEHAQGLDIPVYAPAKAPGAELYANVAGRLLTDFSAEFGPLPSRELTIAQMPDGSVQGFSAPGLLLISERQWGAKPNDELLARLVALQWWGDAVLPASAADVWLSDGLARYSAALDEELGGGAPALESQLQEMSVGALMYEEGAPIARANRMDVYGDDYNSIVISKGAMVFHMLRSAIGSDAFSNLLRGYYAKYSGKNASIDDFKKLAQAAAPAPAAGQPAVNLAAFFSQWLDSTGVPEFKVEYIVYRTQKGFKVVGKILQPLDTFRMPMQIRVDTEGNPETKTVTVIGLSTQFEVNTFGRPKPYGVILDPGNNLLKSSPKLRVHAAIARGESLAEQGKFYDAIQNYQQALDVQGNSSLAQFRMGEAFFYQKNYQASANAFRNVRDGDLDPKWVDVWSHIYLGKIYDLTGQRDRAVNEYSLAQHTDDNTSGAQQEAGQYLEKPYTGDATASPQDTTPQAAKKDTKKS
jgi:tetratricopeptide (TPR) repeat protein